MSRRIKIDANLLGRYEHNFAKGIADAKMQAALRRGGRAIERKLKDLARSVKYKGVYQSGWVTQFSGSGLVMTVSNKAPHYIYVEKGRRPGARRPPIKPILEWVLFHGMSARSAFPVARNIGIRGIKPRPLLTLEITKVVIIKLVHAELLKAFKAAVKSA